MLTANLLPVLMNELHRYHHCHDSDDEPAHRVSYHIIFDVTPSCSINMASSLFLSRLMTTSYDEIHKEAKNQSSFAFAETTYDLSHQSRSMPAPVGM